jgi:fructose-1,6-bisphosphatase I
VFLYPADQRDGYAQGRLRLVYEANPVAMLVEQAGGKATDGTNAILDKQPQNLHERIPFIFGSMNEVDVIIGYHS